MVDNTSTHAKEALKEMRNTDGWTILESILEEKYTSATKALIGSTILDIGELAKNRARCKLIDEILASAGLSKEERKWKIK